MARKQNKPISKTAAAAEAAEPQPEIVAEVAPYVPAIGEKCWFIPADGNAFIGELKTTDSGVRLSVKGGCVSEELLDGLDFTFTPATPEDIAAALTNAGI